MVSAACRRLRGSLLRRRAAERKEGNPGGTSWQRYQSLPVPPVLPPPVPPPAAASVSIGGSGADSSSTSWRRVGIGRRRGEPPLPLPRTRNCGPLPLPLRRHGVTSSRPSGWYSETMAVSARTTERSSPCPVTAISERICRASVAPPPPLPATTRILSMLVGASVSFWSTNY